MSALFRLRLGIDLGIDDPLSVKFSGLIIAAVTISCLRRRLLEESASGQRKQVAGSVLVPY